jgi:hypothetical protein
MISNAAPASGPAGSGTPLQDPPRPAFLRPRPIAIAIAVLVLGLMPVFWFLLLAVVWALGGGDSAPPGSG